MEAQSETTLETHEGTLEHVVYTNERNHWSVARFRLAASGERITIVGVLPALRIGELLRISGRGVVHEKFGPQFEVSRFEAVVPTTAEGIRKYLASGRLRGTGKVLSDRIVARFGADTLHVIDHTPERLLEVEGIGKKKLARILDSWGEGRAARDTLVFLQGHGFGPALAARVHETYGAAAPRTCREQPYRLARDVRRLGFVMADRMARSIGIDEEDPDRLAAGVRHTLQQGLQDGHVACPADDVVQRSARLLRVDPLLIETALEGMIGDAELRAEATGEPGGSGARLVYLPYLHEAECQVAGAFSALRDGRGIAPDEVDRHLDAIARRQANEGGRRRRRHRPHRRPARRGAAGPHAPLRGDHRRARRRQDHDRARHRGHQPPPRAPGRTRRADGARGQAASPRPPASARARCTGCWSTIRRRGSSCAGPTTRSTRTWC